MRYYSLIGGVMARTKVKVVSIPYGLFGNPNNWRIEKSINKWLKKGYTLKTREEQPGGCFGVSQTHLTFIKE